MSARHQHVEREGRRHQHYRLHVYCMSYMIGSLLCCVVCDASLRNPPAHHSTRSIVPHRAAQACCQERRPNYQGEPEGSREVQVTARTAGGWLRAHLHMRRPQRPVRRQAETRWPDVRRALWNECAAGARAFKSMQMAHHGPRSDRNAHLFVALLPPPRASGARHRLQARSAVRRSQSFGCQSRHAPAVGDLPEGAALLDARTRTAVPQAVARYKLVTTRGAEQRMDPAGAHMTCCITAGAALPGERAGADLDVT
jgi:hypothetical protein